VYLQRAIEIITLKIINLFINIYQLYGVLGQPAMAFSMASEIERDLISKRSEEALMAKKAAGVKLGRPKRSGKSNLDKYRPEIEALLATGSSQKFIAKRYGTDEVNLHHWMKKHRLKKRRYQHDKKQTVNYYTHLYLYVKSLHPLFRHGDNNMLPKVSLFI